MNPFYERAGRRLFDRRGWARWAHVRLLNVIALCVPLAARAFQATCTYDEAGNLIAVSDTANDVNNCGRLHHRCGTDPNGTSYCSDGYCQVICRPGFEADPSSGRCLDIQSDISHCGSLEHVCAPAAHGQVACTSGTCVVACEAGYSAGSGTCVPGDDPLNCGGPQNQCPATPGYLPCCTLGHCGASNGDVCVDVATDPDNCGWIGHRCLADASGATTCARGVCVLAEGRPTVESLNGFAEGSEARRLLAFGGLVVHGAALDRVTSVEFEDWGWDTVDGSVHGPLSVPLLSRTVMPLTTGGPMIEFAQTATDLTVGYDSLDRELAHDPQFAPFKWLKLRLHYNEDGQDEFFTIDIPFSFDASLYPPDPHSALSIESVAGYRTYCRAGPGDILPYDPSNGLLLLQDGIDATTLQPPPVAVLTSDDNEIPIERLAPEGLYLPTGLDTDRLTYGAGEGGVDPCVRVVLRNDEASGDRINVSDTQVMLRGRNLGGGQPLLFNDGVPTAVYSSYYTNDRADRLFIGSSLYGTVTEAASSFAMADPSGLTTPPIPVRFTSAPILTGFEGEPYLTLGKEVSVAGAFLAEPGSKAYLRGPSLHPGGWGDVSPRPSPS